MKDSSSIFRPYLARATVAMFALLGASAVVPSSALAAKTVYIDPARPESFAAASDAVADCIDVVIKGGTLVADMDLRGLNRKVTLDGDLDLVGHRIFVRAIDGSTICQPNHDQRERKEQ